MAKKSDKKPAAKESADAEAKPATKAESIDAKPTADDSKSKTQGIKKLASKLKVWQQFKTWSRKKQIVAGAAAVVVVIVLLTIFVRPMRYAFLNVVSDANISITVIDSDSDQPVQGAVITLPSGLSTQTDEDGVVVIGGVDYGNLTFTVSKDAYETLTTTVSVSNGNYTAEPITLVATGIPYEVNVIGAISQQPLDDFTVSIDDTDISAQAVESGVVTLNVPPSLGNTFSITVTADGYNPATAAIDINNAEQPAVQLTLAGKHYFLSNRDGTITLYESNYDGSELRAVVPGTGHEDKTLILFKPIGDGRRAVLVASRKNERNAKDRITQEMYIVDLESGELVLADEGAVEISMRDVDEERVVYTINHSDPQRGDNQKIKTYTYDSQQLRTLYAAESISLNGIVNDKAYVSISRYWTNNRIRDRHFIEVDIKSGDVKNILSGVYLYNFRVVSPTAIRYQTSDDQWYEYDTTIGEAREIDRPDETNNRSSIKVAPDASREVWLESRDGRNVVLIGGQDGSDEQVVPISNDALTNSISGILDWINDDHIIIRVSGSNESANYVLHVDSGNVLKIADVYRRSYYGYY